MGVTQSTAGWRMHNWTQGVGRYHHALLSLSGLGESIHMLVSRAVSRAVMYVPGLVRSWGTAGVKIGSDTFPVLEC